MSMPALTRFKRLDVRPILNEGGEPFDAIRTALSSLKPTEGLLVVAPFLPAPLIELLGGEGFASKIEHGSGSDWLVYFWRDE